MGRFDLFRNNYYYRKEALIETNKMNKEKFEKNKKALEREEASLYKKHPGCRINKMLEASTIGAIENLEKRID